MYVATGLGPNVFIKDFKVKTRGDLTFGWQIFLLPFRDQVQSLNPVQFVWYFVVAGFH